MAMNYPRMTMNIPVLFLNKNHKNPSADVLSLRASVLMSWLCVWKQAFTQALTSPPVASQQKTSSEEKQRKPSLLYNAYSTEWVFLRFFHHDDWVLEQNRTALQGCVRACSKTRGRKCRTVGRRPQPSWVGFLLFLFTIETSIIWEIIWAITWSLYVKDKHEWPWTTHEWTWIFPLF